MFIQNIHFTCVIISMIFISVQASEENRSSSLNILVKEHHESPHLIVNENASTTQRTLIRVTRFNGKLSENDGKIRRSRRQIVEAIQTAGFVISVAKAMKNTETGEEILGMAKTVAIVVIVISSLCAVCCLITIVVVCVKCCCRNKDRKRQQAPTTIQVPQPIFVHSGPSNYQQHSGWNPMMMSSSPEGRPMLPQPSAPPHPHDFIHTEHPPPAYEKLYK